MRYAVNIKPMAQCDLRGIVSYISRKVSPLSADKWHSGIVRKIRSLETNPEMWPEAYESRIVGFEVRQALFGRRNKTYRILFEIAGGPVVVHRVRHAAQDYLTADDF